ncbi:hypothetical protein BgiBS90_000283 [Biomphalaria glabrata]|nr:hypothetical protein BgiBS90_000283 [Biomphalaria glabrata]
MVHIMVLHGPHQGTQWSTSWFSMVHIMALNGPHQGTQMVHIRAFNGPHQGTQWSTSLFSMVHIMALNGPHHGTQWSTSGHSNGPHQGIQWSISGHSMVHNSPTFFVVYKECDAKFFFTVNFNVVGTAQRFTTYQCQVFEQDSNLTSFLRPLSNIAPRPLLLRNTLDQQSKCEYY